MDKTDIEVKKSPAPAASAGTSLWGSFRDEFDDLFERVSKSLTPWAPLFGGGTLPSLRRAGMAPLVPSVDVAEAGNAYTITAELPGLAAEDVDVSVHNGVIVIKGEKQSETKKEDKNYYLSERSYGAFERSFALPEGVDQEHIKAEVAKGVLTVTLPKTEAAQAKSKKIEVKSV